MKQISKIFDRNLSREEVKALNNLVKNKDSLMIQFNSFEQRIMLKSLKRMVYIIKQDKNTKFTSEIEENGSLSFLVIIITRENNKFVTSVHRKPTFSVIFTNFVLYQKCTKVG